MFNKRRLLLGSFYLPGVIVALRVAFTLWIFISNPMGMRFPYIQLIPLGVILYSCFSHFKLYSDSVPVITLIAPSILHFLVILAFVRVVTIVPFLPVLIPDVLYLIAKSVKANLFPFYFEGEEDTELIDVDDIVNEAG